MTASQPWPANRLQPLEFDRGACWASLAAFADFLANNQELEEGGQILPFFQRHPHLAALLGTYNLGLPLPDTLAYELSLFGKYRADIVIGNRRAESFVLVELEDARRGSLFVQRDRVTPYWGSRFEQGFSQIVDWFHLLDDLRTTRELRNLFGSGSIDCAGLLVVGRQALHGQAEQERLEWRRQKVVVDSKHVVCLTYDELLEDLRRRIQVRLG